VLGGVEKTVGGRTPTPAIQTLVLVVRRVRFDCPRRLVNTDNEEIGVYSHCIIGALAKEDRANVKPNHIRLQETAQPARRFPYKSPSLQHLITK